MVFKLFLLTILVSCASVRKGEHRLEIKKVNFPEEINLSSLENSDFKNIQKIKFTKMSSVDQGFLVNQLYMKGVDLKEQGDLKKAVIVFELLNEIVPFDESIRNNLIVSYIRSGSLEKAEVFLLGIINNGSKDNVPYKLILAGLQSAKGDLKQSKKTYLDILEYEPSNEEACVFLAKTYQGEGNIKKGNKPP